MREGLQRSAKPECLIGEDLCHNSKGALSLESRLYPLPSKRKLLSLSSLPGTLQATVPKSRKRQELQLLPSHFGSGPFRAS